MARDSKRKKPKQGALPPIVRDIRPVEPPPDYCPDEEYDDDVADRESIGDEPTSTLPMTTDTDIAETIDWAERCELFNKLAERLQKFGTSPRPSYTTEGAYTDSEAADGHWRRLEARWKNVHDRGLLGCSTGLPQLDAAIGGIQDIAAIAGKTEVGKTSLACQIALAALKYDPGLAVVYWLLDDHSIDDIQDQLLCHLAHIDIQKLERNDLSPGEHDALMAAYEHLGGNVRPRWHTVLRRECAEFGLAACRLFIEAAKVSIAASAPRVLTIIDMINDMPLAGKTLSLETGEPDDGEARQAAANPVGWRFEQIRRFREASCSVEPGGWPVILLAKLRKPVSARGEVGMEDILGSVDAGYVPRQVMLLQPESDASGPEVPVSLGIIKARRGRHVTIPLNFHVQQFRFSERSARQGSADTPKPGRSSGERRPARRKPDPYAG